MRRWILLILGVVGGLSFLMVTIYKNNDMLPLSPVDMSPSLPDLTSIIDLHNSDRDLSAALPDLYKSPHAAGETKNPVVPNEDELARKIKSSNPNDVCMAAAGVPQTASSNLIQIMLFRLNTRNEEIIDCLCKALNQLPADKLLLDWWKKGKSKKAIEYSAYLSHPKLIQIYREAANSHDSDIRLEAAIGLKQQIHMRQEASQILKRLADNSDKYVRKHAISSLSILNKELAKSIAKSRINIETDQNIKLLLQDIIQK